MATMMRKNTAPDHRARFTVGQDKRGRWMVCDRLGLVGGLFADPETALRFAKRACNPSADDVCLLSGSATLRSDAVFGRKSAPFTIVR